LLEESIKNELLSKLDRISKENKNEPLYNSFVRWVCEHYLEIDNADDIDETINGIIEVGGKNDYDTDFFHFHEGKDDDESFMVWGQVKFSETFDQVIERSTMETFGLTLDYLQECPNTANDIFQKHSKLFKEKKGKNAPFRKKMIFIVAGTLNEQVDELLTSPHFTRRLQNTMGPKIEFDVITIDNIIADLVRPKTKQLSMAFDEFTLQRIDKLTNNPSIIGFVKASELVSLVKKYPMMFELNIRKSLSKRNDAFKGMTTVLEDHDKKKQFWKLNNGVTGVCKKLEKIQGESRVEIEDLQIVNGRQTTFCLEENAEHNPKVILDDDVLVSVKIHQTSSEVEAQNITDATNTQNPVKPVDRISNRNEMNALVSQCRTDFPEFYWERQTAGYENASDVIKDRVTKIRLLDKNKTSRAFLAYDISNPVWAIMPDRQLFHGTDHTYYNKIFENRKIRELIMPHIFMYMLNSLDLQWGREHRKKIDTHYYEKQILHKEIVRYFILDLIGTNMEELKKDERIKCENKLIKIMRDLNNKDSVPLEFLELAKISLDRFIFLFNKNRKDTWPKELLTKIETPGYDPHELDRPSHNDFRSVLIHHGNMIRQLLMVEKREYDLTSKDPIKAKLESIANS
jgi:hypothetical protein